MPRLLAASDPNAYLPSAIEVLRRSGVVALPTETVYGMAASVFNSLGVERIFALKGRPDRHPLPVQFASLPAAETFGFRFCGGVRKLAEKFWPGPLTLLLDRPAALPPWFAPGADTIAVRVPGHRVALALLKGFEHPLAVTSANISGEPPALESGDVLAAFPEAEDLLVLDGGRSPGGEASTVVDGRGADPRVLRPGPISRDMLAEAWEP